MSTSRHYESTIIINGALDDDTIRQVMTRTSEYITRNGGEKLETDEWGRRRLAYAIDKKVNGYYVKYEFDAPGEMIPQLERFYQLEEHIIRYLTLTLSDKDLRSRDDMRQRLEAEAAAAEEAAREEAAKDDGE